MPFSSPNYTQAPNDLFDECLKDMGEAELKVMLVIIRYTFGYHRNQVKMSLANIARISGLTENGVIAGAKAAEERGLIERETKDIRPRPATIWKIKLADEVIPQPVRYKNDLYLSQRGMDTSASEVLLKKERNVFKQTRADENEGEEMATADELRKRTEEALFNNMASRSNGGLDLSHYPEDVRPVIQELHILWGISPPSFKGNASKNSRAADWIAGARDLMMTCEEFGLPALERYRREHFEPYMATHKGLAPHTVSRPGSLINPIAGKIGEWRVQSREVSQDNSSTPPATQGLMGKVRVGDKLYIDGKEIVDERPQENTTGI